MGACKLSSRNSCTNTLILKYKRIYSHTGNFHWLISRTHTHTHLFIWWPILIGAATPAMRSSFRVIPPPPPPRPPKHFCLVVSSSEHLLLLRHVSILARLRRPFSLSICRRSRVLIKHDLSAWPLPVLSLSCLTFFSLLLSSVCPSPARLCSPLHQVKGTEGWDLQQRVLLSRGFDQTESRERSLTDC